MSDRAPRHRGVLPAAALLAVLAVVAGALVLQAVRRDAGPAGAAPGSGATAASATVTPVPGNGLDRAALARVLGGPPEDDLPPERFSERVDGADRALREAGCRRILAWRLGGPVPADVELYLFDDPAAAGAFLEERGLPAGKDRAAADGLAFLRAGRCAVLAVPDDPGAAEALVRDRFPGLAPALAAAGCAEGAP